jgi:hypothetical protein
MSAGITMIITGKPFVSTAICLFHPLIIFAGSNPRVALLTVVAPLTDCESTISVTG